MSSISIPPVTHAVAIHPNVQPVSALLGQWNGKGEGKYPTIKDFTYEEELIFTNSGKPFVTYTQRTWLGGSDRTKPMHEENGFFRFVAPGKVEALITQCTGVQEIHAGVWVKDDEKQTITITLNTTGLTRSPSAKAPFVTQVERKYTFDLDGESLNYTVAMATDRPTALQVHLTGALTRPPPVIIAEDDESEEEELEDQLMEPEPERHAQHHHEHTHPGHEHGCHHPTCTEKH